MFKTYKFKTYCKGESHSSKTANIIDERPYMFKRNRIQIQVNGFWLEQLISLNLKTNSGGGQGNRLVFPLVLRVNFFVTIMNVFLALPGSGKKFVAFFCRPSVTFTQRQS